MSDPNPDETCDDRKPVPQASSSSEIVIDSDNESNNGDNSGDSKEDVKPRISTDNKVLDTLTLSSDEELEENTERSYVLESVENEPENFEHTQRKDEEALKDCDNDLHRLIDLHIESLIKKSVSDTIDQRCKKIEDGFECLLKEIADVSGQCRKFKESADKYKCKETHITGEGDINEDLAILEIDEPVQRVVGIDQFEGKISKDIPVNEDNQTIILGDLVKRSQDPDIDIVATTTRADLQASGKLPKLGPIVRKPLARDDQVYAVENPRNAANSKWLPGIILETCKISGKTMYNVTFEDSIIPSIYVKGTQMAYRKTPSVMLSNRNRVIAQYTSEHPNRLGGYNRALFSGLVAEVPRSTNIFRYLIFFDNGSVAYVPPEDVFLIFEEGLSYLDDVPEERRFFLRKYFDNYPERALVKYSKGAKDFVLIGDKWVSGRVKLVDCSLVRFYFRSIEKYEWIYRGSPRLKPLSSLLKSSSQKTGKQRALRKGSILPFSRKPRPYVQYVRDEDSTTDDEDKRYSSKSGFIIRPRLNPFGNKVQTEFELFPDIVIKPERFCKPNAYNPHRCSPNCINIAHEDISRYRDINPYAVPVICGWDRQVTSYSVAHKNRKKQIIFYIAPCGRRLRNIEDVDTFLDMTNSNLTIDFFTFHSKLVLYSELDGGTRQGCYYYEPDITRGTENHSISCINWQTDESITPGFQYWPARFPGKGVNLELDPHFMICCDCTDGCRDKTKCECQQLTKETYEIYINYFNEEETEIGYKHKRLHSVVSTGIWECNTNCSCNSSCANRLVQHGIRVRLQLFRTDKKGWGIRCLHDIPPGTFICIYAAEVLNEEGADELGSNFGDEYLADLDYIEMVEGMKKGYEQAINVDLSSDESESTISSDQDTDCRPNRGRRKTSRRRFSNKKTKKSPEKKKKSKKPFKPIREMFGESFTYSLDAKRKGNVGRYFNHSCDPNCYVQNVFIDTHDLRFPWVALFACKFIPAFTELNWDYNYEIIEGRKMWCHCGSENCRGRLL